MLEFLTNKFKSSNPYFLPEVDMHAHILPGIDDGASNIDESLSMIEGLYALGYRHLIATPHIYKTFYPNTSAIILEKLGLVRQALSEKKINIRLDAAAEYFMDDHFEVLLQNNDILTLPGGFVLVEMSFIAEQRNFRQTLFDIQIKGFKPILAHPERYPYLNQNMKALQYLVDGGCRLQINLLSLIGIYGKGPQISAEKMIKHKLVSMVGTDVHNMQHIDNLNRVQQSGAIRRLIQNYDFDNRKLTSFEK